jgi:hypothetical protein
VKALDPTLNQAILAVAPRIIRAAPLAPECFPDLMRYASNHAGMLVFDGASHHSIYADARVNHAFRAWHDAVHVRDALDFSPAGEAATFEGQVKDLEIMFPCGPIKRWRAILRAEIIGQVEHYFATGVFPDDQFAFVQSCLTAETQ